MAILCNHQRAVPKGHAGQMEKLSEKMHKLNEELLELQHELKAAEKGKAYGDKKKREPDRCAVGSFCLDESGLPSVHLRQLWILRRRFAALASQYVLNAWFCIRCRFSKQFNCTCEDVTAASNSRL